MYKVFIILFYFCYLIFFAHGVQAHPHGNIAVKADFLFENKKIDKINVELVIDEFNSMMFIETLDNNRDGVIDSSEKANFMNEIQNFIVQKMKPANYFIQIKNNNNIYKELSFDKIIASYKNEKICIKYTIKPFLELDPVKNNIAISFYDNSYYYEVYMDEKNPVKFEGDNNINCSYKVSEDLLTTYYYNMVNPEQIELICK